ncbi:uncharacterized protein BDFB_007116 [Asbolus verrucosus]|uniref:Msta n=1 Tax=Asbolus verrucosus TaxID=1661398 RepID=A0A482V7C3_ASBVE|nr:uncharacterized protein BDFB_007116 [Asbolus verrucosus]
MDAKNGDKTRILESNVCVVCQNPALHKCGGCHRVYYCNKQHQRDDWKQHKLTCKPFKICEDEVLGRHLVATRPLQPGEFVLQEAPLVWGPSSNTVPICLGCGKGVNAQNSRSCSRCGWPVCGDLCEKSPGHLAECRYTTQRGERVSIKNFGIPHPIYRCITVLRCLYQKQFLPKIWKKLEVLEAHCESRRASSNYENDRVTVAEFIRRFFKLSSVFSEEDIMKVFGIVMVNSHEVPLTEPPFIAIYGTSSMFEHNCSANCSKSFTNQGHILITAAQPIQEGDHLSISYTDSLWGTPNRRYFLHETKFFWCHCSRCEDPTEFGTNFSALKCQDTNCSGLLLPETFTETQKLPEWVCTRCSHSISSYSAHDILERIGRDLHDLDKNDVEACKSFLSTYQGYLSDNHFYRTDIKYVLSQLLGQQSMRQLSEEDLALKLECCQALESLVKTIGVAERRILGTVLFEMHAALAEVARRSGGTNELMKSRRILIEAIEMLSNEPEVLPEGKICKQARQNLKDIDVLLEKL